MERERLVEDACLPCPVAHVSSARLFRLAPARLPFSIRLASPWLPQPIASFFDKHVSAGCDEIAEATPATTTTRERGRRRAAGDEGSRGRGRGGARRKATGTLLENGNATTKQTLYYAQAQVQSLFIAYTWLQCAGPSRTRLPPGQIEEQAAAGPARSRGTRAPRQSSGGGRRRRHRIRRRWSSRGPRAREVERRAATTDR
jgi:hypothetical protein